MDTTQLTEYFEQTLAAQNTTDEELELARDTASSILWNANYQSVDKDSFGYTMDGPVQTLLMLLARHAPELTELIVLLLRQNSRQA